MRVNSADLKELLQHIHPTLKEAKGNFPAMFRVTGSTLTVLSTDRYGVAAGTVEVDDPCTTDFYLAEHSVASMIRVLSTRGNVLLEVTEDEVRLSDGVPNITVENLSDDNKKWEGIRKTISGILRKALDVNSVEPVESGLATVDPARLRRLVGTKGRVSILVHKPGKPLGVARSKNLYGALMVAGGNFAEDNTSAHFE